MAAGNFRSPNVVAGTARLDGATSASKTVSNPRLELSVKICEPVIDNAVWDAK